MSALASVWEKSADGEDRTAWTVEQFIERKNAIEEKKAKKSLSDKKQAKLDAELAKVNESIELLRAAAIDETSSGKKNKKDKKKEKKVVQEESEVAKADIEPSSVTEKKKSKKSKQQKIKDDDMSTVVGDDTTPASEETPRTDFSQQNADVECRYCHEMGHYLRECPQLQQKEQRNNNGDYNNNNRQQNNRNAGSRRCWRCGNEGHSVPDCPQEYDPQNPTPFASCHICKETGHMSNRCPQSPTGVYPKGGSCFNCGSIQHLARDCEMRDEKLAEKRMNRKRGRNEGFQDRNQDGGDWKRPRGTRGGKRVQDSRAQAY